MSSFKLIFPDGLSPPPTGPVAGLVGSGDVYFLAVSMGICEVIEDEVGNSKEKQN